MNKSKYSILAEMANDLLAIPVTTVASESAFNIGGRTLSPHQSRLHLNTLEAIMCSQHWIWATSGRSIKIFFTNYFCFTIYFITFFY